VLIWVCALHCEAKPVIDFYRLKKSRGDEAFDVYRNDDMTCVISGPGKLASAAASAWIAARVTPGPSPLWINLGTAGAAEHELGSPFLLHQVVDADSGQRYYPMMPEKPSIAGHAGLCLSQPSTDYREEYLFDMESSGFMQAALRFSSAELVRSLKVVSDNRQIQTGRDRQRVSDLIQQNIGEIDAQTQSLYTLGQPISALETTPEAWDALVSMTRFSETQRSRLRVLLRYLLNRQYRIDELIEFLGPLRSAGAMLGALEQMCHRDSERL
jgi:adenosylhomocysteine nucleosidase